MKDIRIFIASSKELLPERNYLAYLALAHEGEFERRGFRVRLSKWEYVDPTMTEVRTEDRYLDEMLNCDAVLMMFRHVLGMYTKEEVDKAIAAEVAGTSRIKKHLMLFKEGDVEPSAELANWRATLAEGTYGTFADFGELKAHFLRLVEELSGLPMQDLAQEEPTRTVSAFIAVDDELAADRDAFADAVLNLNDVLVRRGARVRLRFYDPEKHREMLESSEMALVLYHTKYGDFGEKALGESFDRSKRDENPKRLYVFFRDANGQPTEDGFGAFMDGFADKFGSAPCRFENVDTLSLNFLFSLESILGDDGGTFVKLDGRTVVADGLEVGDLVKLPMLEKNEGLSSLFSRMQEVSKRFVDQRGKCEKDPQDDGLYVELLDISAEKNRLQDQIDRELKMSFNLAKRMAAVSIAQTNETIACARAKIVEGKIKEALEILDGASAATSRRRLLHRAAERAEAEERQVKELKAGIEIEYFRIDAVMAYTAMPFDERFKKAEGIYKSLVEDVEAFAELCTHRNHANVVLALASLLHHFGRFLMIVNDVKEQIRLFARAKSLLNDGHLAPDLCCEVLADLGSAFEQDGQIGEAESAFCEAKAMTENIASEVNRNRLIGVCSGLLASFFKHQERILESIAEFSEAVRYGRRGWLLNNLAGLYCALGRLDEAEEMYRKVISVKLTDWETSGRKDDKFPFIVLGNLARVHGMMSRYEEAEQEFEESLSYRRRLARENPAGNAGMVANCLRNLVQMRLCMESSPGREKTARIELDECKEIYRRLSLAGSRKYMADYADVLALSGELYRKENNYASAEAAFCESIEILRDLQKLDEVRFTIMLARHLHLLACCQAEYKQLAKASSSYEESIALMEKVACTIRSCNEELYAWTNEYADMLDSLGEMDKARYYREKSEEPGMEGDMYDDVVDYEMNNAHLP